MAAEDPNGFCSHCGWPRSAGDFFCVSCGRPPAAFPEGAGFFIRNHGRWLVGVGLLVIQGMILWAVSPALHFRPTPVSQSPSFQATPAVATSTPATTTLPVTTAKPPVPALNLSRLASATVKLLCATDSRAAGLQQGSGTLWRFSRGAETHFVILTNRHVVETDDGSRSRCSVVLYPDPQDTSRFLRFASRGHRVLESFYDLAALTPELTTGTTPGTLADLRRHALPVDELNPCQAPALGDPVAVFGYPAIGGDSLTMTEGILSGTEYAQGVRYFKTSAKIDHGNSGGLALKRTGCLLGVPTFVRSGSLESLGRILDLGQIYRVAEWLTD